MTIPIMVQSMFEKQWNAYLKQTILANDINFKWLCVIQIIDDVLVCGLNTK